MKADVSSQAEKTTKKLNNQSVVLSTMHAKSVTVTKSKLLLLSYELKRKKVAILNPISTSIFFI